MGSKNERVWRRSRKNKNSNNAKTWGRELIILERTWQSTPLTTKRYFRINLTEKNRRTTCKTRAIYGGSFYITENIKYRERGVW